MNATARHLQFPSFESGKFPPPELTLEEWLEWIEWVKSDLVSAEQLNTWIHDPNREAVPIPFVL
jgi:hypothetical protein